MAHLKQKFGDALSAIEPGEATTNGLEAHPPVRSAFPDPARSSSPVSPEPLTSEDLPNA